MNSYFRLLIQHNLLQYPQVVKQFLSAYKKGFVPRGVPYSPYYTTQSYETKLLFDLLYYANDYDTFFKVIMPLARYQCVFLIPERLLSFSLTSI